MTPTPTRLRLLLMLAALMAVAADLPAQRRSAFRIEEATIADLQREIQERRLTCRALVQHYLDRIEAFDKKGPAINAIVVVNPTALARADELDALTRSGKTAGPLHCIPTIVKDNFETTDLPTTAGSLALKGWTSARDAFQVQAMRRAGAVILAKSNMAEFAFSPVETVSSILPGYTKNPYALDRVTAGSSGGTAAAVAANMGAVGLGSDTGDSIRGPAAHQALAGIRSTMGLTSRSGVVPLNLSSDIAGPLTRSLEDAVRILQVIAGPDPRDPITAQSAQAAGTNYLDALKPGGLKGARLGILRQAYESETTDREVVTVFEQAVAELRKQGAFVVDRAVLPDLDEMRREQTGNCNQFKFDLNTYLSGLEPRPPLLTLEEIIKSRNFHPSIEKRLELAQAVELPPDQNPGCRSRDAFRSKLRSAVLKLMEEHQLDALIYPTWSNPPRLIGDLNTPAGDNNQLFSPSTGFPAITVPMGYTRGNALPAGLQFFGRPWSESGLIRLAYAYEQATRHRRPPATTPAIPRRK